MGYRRMVAKGALVLLSCSTISILPSMAQGQTSVNESNSNIKVKALEKKTTPKFHGHPSLEGNWFSGSGAVPPLDFVTTRSADGSITAAIASNKDNGALIKQQFDPTSIVQPDYKDEYVAKVKDNFFHENKTDRVYSCGSPGLPRIGAPQRIVQNNKEIIFLYSDIAGMVWRIIPLNAKGPRTDTDASYYGDAMGHWDGDTLVINTKNFSDETWFGEFGYFHSDKMEVTERLRRIGDTVRYDVTVSDPGVLKHPWQKPTRIMTKVEEEIQEPTPCHIDPGLEGASPDGQFHAQRF